MSCAPPWLSECRNPGRSSGHCREVGFIGEDEDALAAAVRILKTKTGWKALPSSSYKPSVAAIETVVAGRFPSPTTRWSRFPRWSTFSTNVEVASVDGISSLPFDHLQILRSALDRVRSKTLYSSLPVHLMPPTFTSPSYKGSMSNVWENPWLRERSTSDRRARRHSAGTRRPAGRQSPSTRPAFSLKKDTGTNCRSRIAT